MPTDIYTHQKDRIEKKHNYTYLITNVNNGMMYIGVRSCECEIEEDFKYMGSSKYLKAATKEDGIENFKKEILSDYKTRDEAESEEGRIQLLNDVVVNDMYYNRSIQTNTGFSTAGLKYSKERRMRMSKVKQSPETIKKIADARRGQKTSPETVKKIADSNRGKTRNQRQIQNMVDGIMKRTPQQKLEIGRKISVAISGIKNGGFKGYYITPWGKFITTEEASITASSKISRSAIRRYCIEDVKITNKSIPRSQYLTELDVGKTSTDLGFTFEPK